MAAYIAVIGLVLCIACMIVMFTDFGMDNAIGIWVIGMAVGFVLLVGGVASMSAAENSRLMAQCIGDGKKEYECRSLLREPQSSVVPMPIIIPMGR